MKNTLLLATALLFAPAAFAQAPPTEKQMRDNADAQNRMDKGIDVGKSQRQYFNSIDRGQKGYHSNDDVSADPFLSKNFANCDSDHDGKMTFPEYAICTRDNPPPDQ